MALHSKVLPEPSTGRYCSVCDENWHEPYAHKSGDAWHMPAADGKYYFVLRGICNCPSYYFGRRPCKHVERAHQLDVQGLKHDLPHQTWLYYEQLRWPEDTTLDEIRGSID